MTRSRRLRRCDATRPAPSVATMLILPWTPASAVGPETTCTVLAARLPLRRYRTLPRALVHALAMRRALTRTPGLVGHALGVQVRGKTLWTISAWTDRTALVTFERSRAHRSAKDGLRERLLPSTLAVWTCPVRDLPLGWDEVRRRMASTGRH